MSHTQSARLLPVSRGYESQPKATQKAGYCPAMGAASVKLDAQFDKVVVLVPPGQRISLDIPSFKGHPARHIDFDNLSSPSNGEPKIVRILYDDKKGLSLASAEKVQSKRQLTPCDDLKPYTRLEASHDKDIFQTPKENSHSTLRPLYFGQKEPRFITQLTRFFKPQQAVLPRVSGPKCAEYYSDLKAISENDVSESFDATDSQSSLDSLEPLNK